MADWPLEKTGSKGEDVITVQYLLDTHGAALTVDGDFGPLTKAAVQRFQSANGLTADGEVGGMTWPRLVVVVKSGSTGNAVKAVQSQLTSLAIDGIFGPGTEAAVNVFQSEHGLTVDGIVGPTTWKQLVAADDVGSGNCWPGGSSPAHFDPSTGQYAVFLYSADISGRVVSFDVVQFLVGDDAVTAYHKDNPSATDGPPNDYYIVNATVRVDTATVAANAGVRLLDPQQNLQLTSATFEQLPQVLPGGQNPGNALFWLTFHNSVVTEICQQFTP